MTQPEVQQRPLKRSEVATLFGVSPQTVTSWAEAGRLGSTRTVVGGHYRFDAAEVYALLNPREESTHGSAN